VRLAQLGWRLAESEVDAVVAEVREGVGTDEALHRQALRRRAITRLVAAVRHGSVSSTVKRLMGIGDHFQAYSSELLHVPSQLFLKQHGLTDFLAECRERAENDSAHAVFLGRLLIGLGRYAEAGRWLERGSQEPPHAIGMAHMAITRIFLGEAQSGHELIARAEALAPSSMLVLAFRAVAHAHKAAQAKDMLQASAEVSAALEYLGRSREVLAPEDPLERLEAWLSRGRISLLMPPDFGVHSAGVDDLRAVLAADPAPDATPGVAEIFQLHACYFLGVDLSRAGSADTHAEAIELLRRVIVIDPVCSFAERAYRTISEIT